jgi:hypothetical protein
MLSAVLLAGLAQASDADALRARHAALSGELADSSFGRPLHVRSSASGGEHAGEVHAVVDQPYRVVAGALRHAAHWCDILALQVNVKLCEAAGDAPAQILSVFITRKPRDPVDTANRVDFDYEVAAASDNYLRVALTSPSGPVGTRDYRLRLEAAPLDARRTFIHMSYSYALGFMARFAMDVYLSTSGRDKVGFSVVDRLPDGRPVYVDGVRGVVERSAMRYYLAIEAYLHSLSAPPGQRLDARLRDWYAQIQRYPLQLRESIGPDEYLKMKRTQASAANSG